MNKLPQAFNDNLKRFKKSHPKEWEEKYRKATQRTMSSAFFYISGQACYERQNKLMVPIAYYYSLYHMSKALLVLLPKYSMDDLRQMSHTKTIHLVKAEFVDRKMLDEDFVGTLEYFKSLREGANYSMGTWISLDEDLKKQAPKVKKCLCKGIELLKDICSEEISNIMSLIGDGIGDDWIDSYLSKEEEQAVVNFFLENNITT